MANLGNDDLDALLDDCMVTLNEQERLHEEEVKKREEVRAAELENVFTESSENSDLMRLLEEIMTGTANDSSADPTALIEKLKAEITRTATLVESMPEVTDEDRSALTRVRQLFDMLSSEELMEEKERDTDTVPNGGEVKEETFDKVLQQLLAETGQFQEKCGGGDVGDCSAAGGNSFLPTPDGAAGAGDQMDSLNSMLLDFLLNPQLLEPLKLMRESYPSWLEANASCTSAEDMERYKKQYELTIAICDHISDGHIDRSDESKVTKLVSLMHDFTSLAPLPPGLGAANAA